MTGKIAHREPWALVRRQHGVVARWQLLELGYSRHAIAERLARGRLHPVHLGVYAVGRAELTQLGRWMAAVLACGPDAVISHSAAVALWGIAGVPRGPIEVSVPPTTRRTRPGIKVHRRTLEPHEITTRHGVPVTSPAATLVDVASRHKGKNLHRAISQADQLDLIHEPELRVALDQLPRRPGRATLRKTLDRRTFRMTRSELERWFLPIAQQAGLPVPETCVDVNGFEVDFFWPELELVVEADSLRYHRTATAQTNDRIRDQAHARAGLQTLRFTHEQIRYQPRYARATLATVARRLRDRP